jgi:hypothetical protein
MEAGFGKTVMPEYRQEIVSDGVPWSDAGIIE